MPAPLKNQNAVKEEGDRLSSFLTIRCHPRDKAGWVKAAKGKLAAWVIETLNRAAR